MTQAAVPGLRPIRPVLCSPVDYPGDQCKCRWMFDIRRNIWTLTFVNSACLWREGPEGPHFLLAMRIEEARNPGVRLAG